jgi:hypothetical protein
LYEIRPSLTTSKDGQISDNIHSKTTNILTPAFGGQFIPAKGGQGHWLFHLLSPESINKPDKFFE